MIFRFHKIGNTRAPNGYGDKDVWAEHRCESLGDGTFIANNN